MKKINKALLRSLLRWTHQPETKFVPFSLYPSQFGCENYLPKILSVDGCKGVRKSVLWAFRNNPDSSNATDAGFEALKWLNNYQKKLKYLTEQRNLHSSVSIFQYAKLNVGQIVEHRVSKLRGVIIGWDIDPLSEKQHLEIIFDTNDISEFGKRQFETNKLLDGMEFDILSDKALHRIHNDKLWNYFICYDESVSRFRPNDQLSYSYPLDITDVVFSSPFLSREGKESTEVFISYIDKIMHKIVLSSEIFFPDKSSEGLGAEPIIVEHILGEIISQMKTFVQTTKSLNQSYFCTEVIHDNSDGPSSINNKAAHLFEVLQMFVEFVASLDQLLQLRYQTIDIGALDRLKVSDDKSKIDFSDAFETMNNYEFFDTFVNTNRDKTMFELGQIVHHKLYRYRGVISGYDVRPTVDTSKWMRNDGRSNQNQPFYRVIPHEKDIEQLLGNLGKSRPYYYVAEDDLESVDDPTQMHIDHWNISRYFLGWNSDAYRFRLPHALKYCFPSGYHAFPVGYPAESIQSHWRTMNGIVCRNGEDNLELSYTIGSEDDDNMELLKVKIIDKEIAVYEKVDRFLLESYHMMKLFFAKARTSHDEANHTVSILLKLLRYAPTKQSSLAVENLMWQVWMSHENPLVNSCMRLGYSALKGGNNKLAVKYFEFVINNADSSYSEAHNKLAAAEFAIKNFEKSASSASSALKHFPKHFGALAGLGLSIEQLEKRKVDELVLIDTPFDAAIAYKRVLECHPWAHSISTVLQSERNSVPKVV